MIFSELICDAVWIMSLLQPFCFEFCVFIGLYLHRMFSVSDKHSLMFALMKLNSFCVLICSLKIIDGSFDRIVKIFTK